MKLALMKNPDRYSLDEIYVGRLAGFKILIIYSARCEHWYFRVIRQTFSYNSLWDKAIFYDLSTCKDAAEAWVTLNTKDIKRRDNFGLINK